jgi:segregation and condensation protein B
MEAVNEPVDEPMTQDEQETPAGESSEESLDRLAHVVESILFAAAAPVSLKRLVEILGASGGPKPTAKELQGAIERLRSHYAPRRRGIQLVDVAGGYQLRTARENAEWVRAVFRDKPARLGRASLETLAIIAYKQPVTRADIESIRGVDVDGVLSTLLARRLIKTAGRKEAVGRPLLYATTPEFLEVFGLKDVSDLPTLQELAPDPEGGEAAAGDDNAEKASAETAVAEDAPGVAEADQEPADTTVDDVDGSNDDDPRHD